MDECVVFTEQHLTELGRVSSVVPSPCGRWLAAAVSRLDEKGARYVSDLWRVDSTGQQPALRLTRGGSDNKAPCFRRDGGLGFLSNRQVGEKPEGGESDRYQVWLLAAEGGEPRPLTDEPLGVSAFRFAARGEKLLALCEVHGSLPLAEQRAWAEDRKKAGPSALHYDAGPVRHWDAWLPPTRLHLVAFDAEGQGRKDLTPTLTRQLRDAQWDVSPDGSHAAITFARPGEDRVDDRYLLVIDTTTGASWPLGDDPLTIWEHPKFSPDGQWLVAVRHTRSLAEHGPKLMEIFDPFTGESRPLCPDFDRWPHPWAWTEDGTAVLLTADDWGYAPVLRADVVTGEMTRLSASSAGGSHEGLAPLPGARGVVGVRHSVFHPPEPFRLELAPESEPALLACLSGWRPEQGRALAQVEDSHIPAEDGAPVQTFLVRPRGHGPDPLLFWVHGGPRSQWADAWHWRWNALLFVSQGYAVALPNPRGSTGAGQAFLEGIWGNQWGASCYRDLMAVADDLARRPELRADRTACMGASFGGYMTNWIGANTSRFRCLVSHAGLFSFTSFHGVTDNPAFWALEMGGAPYGRWPDVERYSPASRIDAWETPTLIIHGEKDYRVPVSEGLSLFEALQHHGVEAELLIFPDENHWIQKPRNIKAWYSVVLSWLKRHLA